MTALRFPHRQTASPSPATLALDFIGRGDTLDPRITFSRTATATRFNSAGTLESVAINGPRFDYNPATLAARGLLIEEQRTNLLLYSEQIGNAYWGIANSTVVSDSVIAPDGALTGDTLIANTSNAEHNIDSASISITSGTTYTFTAYVKAAGLPDIGLRFTVGSLWGGASPQVRFNLVNLTATTIGGTPASSSITNAGNGWYRIQMSVAATNTGSASARFQLMSGANNVFAGDGTSGVYIWGAQLEAGAFQTSYIPTVASQVTRTADVASMTGTNFSDWYNASEGTIYFEGGTPSDYSTGFLTLFSVNDATANNNIQPAINASANVLNVEMKVSGSVVAGFFPAYVSGNTKLGFAYKLNDANYAKDGVSGSTDTSAAIPVVSQINIGANQVPTNFLNGYIRRIAFYPRRLSNDQLRGITV
jgi:hypothetical protein